MNRPFRWLANHGVTFDFALFCAVIILARLLLVGPFGADQEISAQLARIEESVVDLTNEADLLQSSDFEQILRDPSRYRGPVQSVLEDEGASDTRKRIAVLSMQSLPFDEFLTFCDDVFRLRTTGRVSSAVFRNSVFPEFTWNTTIQEHYTDQRVIELLVRIRDASELEDHERQMAANVLSGQALRDVLELRKGGVLSKRSIAWWYRAEGLAIAVAPWAAIGVVAILTAWFLLWRRNRRSIELTPPSPML